MCLKRNGIQSTFKVHRLVAFAFIPNPENKPQVNHIDGNKLNNRVENLEWSTNSENVSHAYKMGLNVHPLGEESGNSKLTEKQVTEIYNRFLNNEKQNHIADSLGIHRGTVGAICRKRNWKWLTNKIDERLGA